MSRIWIRLGRLRSGAEASVAFRSAKVRGFRGAKGDNPQFLIPVLVVLLTAGCTSIKAWNSSPDNFHAARVKRDQEISRHLADSRDAAEFNAAMDRWNQQDVPGCRQRLEQLLARNPNHADARLLMADVLVAGNHPEQALQQVQQALKAHPDNPDVQYATGLMLDATGHRREALAYYAQAAKKVPTNEAYTVGYEAAQAAADGKPSRLLPPDERDNPQIPINAALAALGRNQPRAAIDVLTPATERFPKSAAIYRLLGISFYRLADYKSSQVALGQALLLDKSNASSYFLMGCTLAKLGRQQEANTHYRQAQALDLRYVPPR
jgi:tetratricopeptide (TPR) repeat protein